MALYVLYRDERFLTDPTHPENNRAPLAAASAPGLLNAETRSTKTEQDWARSPALEASSSCRRAAVLIAVGAQASSRGLADRTMESKGDNHAE